MESKSDGSLDSVLTRFFAELAPDWKRRETWDATSTENWRNNSTSSTTCGMMNGAFPNHRRFAQSQGTPWPGDAIPPDVAEFGGIEKHSTLARPRPEPDFQLSSSGRSRQTGVLTSPFTSAAPMDKPTDWPLRTSLTPVTKRIRSRTTSITLRENTATGSF